MVAPVYATAADFEAYTGKPPPDDVERRLARASERVDELLRAAWYPLDEATQLPTMPDHIDAVTRATCAQAAWMLAMGDEYGVAAAFKDVSIGSVKLSRAGGNDSGPARHAPDAASILQLAGLLPGYVVDASAWW